MVSDTYTLDRDAAESRRLDMQHQAWAKGVGYLIHPRIAETLPRDAKIADVGTGTGIWLMDLANASKDKEYE